MNFYRTVIFTSLASIILILFNGQIYSQDPKNYEKSLHYTRAGADHWYCLENGGFETLTKMRISKDCLNCHARENASGVTINHEKYNPSCADCHDKADSKSVNNEACRNCHTHQMAEIAAAKDVHREKGMICIDCHSKFDTHGNGRDLRSIYDGAIEKTCETCHEKIGQSVSHTVHKGNLDCSACHIQTQVTCFNCHFESGKINAGLSGYILLARNSLTKKVQAANFMGLTFRDKSFIAVSPYKAHTISKEGRKCNDCHGSANIRKYEKTKKIILASWDPKKGMVSATPGVIPVPEDWQKAFVIDFVVYDASNKNNKGWSLLKKGADKSQMLFLDPLDAAAMKKLSAKK